MSRLRHDPIQLIVQHLYDSHGYDHEQRTLALRQTREYIVSLREKYTRSPCVVDYRDPYYRAAYMIAYFPHHIETLHRVLEKLPTLSLEGIFDAVTRVTFLGAGPAPELLGLSSYLAEHQPQVKELNATLIDASDLWTACRELCVGTLVPHYWQGSIRVWEHHCDILRCPNCKDLVCYDSIMNSRLLVLQNCLNDMVHDREGTINSIGELIYRVMPGTIVVLIDLDFGPVVSLLRNLYKTMKDKPEVEILIAPGRAPDEFCSDFTLPPELAEHVFDNKEGAIPRVRTRYFSLVVKKIGNDCPF